jgi:catechol 2,3-dioxygenase-like lactoylglutathione lyase family enzyme
MSARLNHTIVWCSDKMRSSTFLTEILDLPAARPFYHFQAVDLDNQVSLDFYEKEGPVAIQHYAFLIDEQAFDAAFERIRSRAIPYWADPARTRPNEVNSNDGGRGLYFEDPDGHFLEIITRPYGSGQDS